MATATSAVPWFYTLFFLYIEPVATAVGAYYAHLDQSAYMTLTMEMARPATAGLLGVSTQESIVLSQLANMYFVFVGETLCHIPAASAHTIRKGIERGIGFASDD